MEYKIRILEVVPDARESDDHIVTAYVKIKVDGKELWCYVPEWRSYFPYYPKPSKYGLGKTLTENLTGRHFESRIQIVYLKAGHPKKPEKRIMQDGFYSSADSTTLTGRIIDEKSDLYFIDCGIIVETEFDQKEKEEFKVGDYIQVEGILYAILSPGGGGRNNTPDTKIG